MKHWFLGAVAFLLLGVAAPGLDTKNGLQVEVSRKTTGRNDTRGDWYTYQHIDRTMSLHVTAKNVSMKDFPEGVIEYSLLVKKAGYSPDPVYYLYTGKEKLPALKVAASADVVLGSAQVTGWRDLGTQQKDKLDYKITVKHGATETITVSSNASFDAIAKRATKKS